MPGFPAGLFCVVSGFCVEGADSAVAGFCVDGVGFCVEGSGLAVSGFCVEGASGVFSEGVTVLPPLCTVQRATQPGLCSLSCMRMRHTWPG